jgi:hypothetical protein
MSKITTCPNINLPEWKALVDKVGNTQAYKEYLKNNQNVPTLEEVQLIEPDNSVNATMKAITILQTPKADEIFRKGDKNNWDINKILTELAVPKEQQELIKSFNTRNKEEILTSLLTNYSYTVEINTAKKAKTGDDFEFFEKDGKYYENNPYNGKREISKDEYISYTEGNTQHYSNLTVPGGINYTENEIATPAITPSIKGHAQFSTDNGIGWFRSDDKVIGGKTVPSIHPTGVVGPDGEIEPIETTKTVGGVATKTRRILELQSDLFQKGREKEFLVDNYKHTPGDRSFNVTYENKEYKVGTMGGMQRVVIYKTLEGQIHNENPKQDWLTQEEIPQGLKDIVSNKFNNLKQEVLTQNKSNQENQFLQLLNKDNNWVTFFVKSIIQDSAKKGYEKVLFPTGNTASKVEGHTTLEEFKKQKEDRIEDLRDKKKKGIVVGQQYIFGVSVMSVLDNSNGTLRKGKNYIWESDVDKITNKSVLTSETAENIHGVKFRVLDVTSENIADSYDLEINQLKQELERVESEGFGALKPIYNFYENTVTNILKKVVTKENLKIITDEYGNTWLEVSIANNNSTEFSFALSNEFDTNNPFILKGFDDLAQQLEAIDTIASTVIYDLERTPVVTYYEDKDTGAKITEEQYKNLTQKESLRQYKQRVKRLSFEEAINNYKTELEGYSANPDVQVILANYDELKNIVKEKLQHLGLIRKKKFHETTEDVNESDDDSKIDYTYRKDDWVFNYDQKDNAQKELKKFLAFVPVTIYKDGQYTTVNNYLGDGNYKYMSYDEVFEQLHAILSDTDVINTWESMSNKLKEYEIAKPWINSLFKIIESRAKQGDDMERLKRQLVVALSSSYSNYHTMLWKTATYFDTKTNTVKRYDDRYNFRLIKTDRNGIIDTIISDWKTNFRTLKFIESDGNDIKLSKEYIDKTIVKINSLKSAKSIKDIKDALEMIGVNIEDATALDILNGKFDKKNIEQHFNSKSGLFKLILDRLNGLGITEQEIETNFDRINPLVSNSAIRKLASLDSNYKPTVYSNSTRNSKGDSMFNYTMNKFLTNEYKKLLNDKEYAQAQLGISFNNIIKDNDGNALYESWLYNLANNPEKIINDFDIIPFESLKHQEGSKDNQRLSELDDTSLEAFKVNLVLNGDNIREKKSRLIKYLFSVPDKTTAYIIKGIAIKPDIQFLTTGDYLIRKSNVDALYQMFASEHNRILSSQERTYEDNANYEKGSKLFFFFPQFNDDTNLKTTEGKIKLPTDTVFSGKTVEEYIKEELTKLIKKDVTTKLAQWNEQKIIDGKKVLIDNTYLDSKEVKGHGKDGLTYAAYDYVLNSMLAKYNFHQTFAGDPALYYNAKKPNIAETWNEISKRLAGLIAPGKDLYLDQANEDFIHITLTDNKRGSLNYDEYVKLLGKDEADAYKEGKFDNTDAHELITFKERLNVLYKSGALDTKQYDDILSRYNKDPDNFVLNRDDAKIYDGGAEKPVYFGKRVISADDVVYNDYVKSSAIPLIPQFTKGLEIDKLRKAMESLEKRKGKTVRVAYKSGVKLGGTKPINIWKDKESSIIDDLKFEDGDFIYLQRNNFRIQQDLPYDENKQEVIKGSQPTKLLFDTLLSLKGVDDKFFSEKYTEWIDLHKQLFQDSYNTLHNKIISKETDQVDIKLLANILKEEAEARDYSFNEVEFLKLSEGQDEFVTALWANPSANKFESLITSLYTNGIVRQKMHGKSYVLMPEEGLKGYSEDITYTANYTGELKPDEVLIPWNFRDNIKRYINKETGLIEISLMDEDLLKLFGFRIPNQGHSSMTPIKIVGFLPDYMRDTIVASRDLIAQMGSDFDVDKLYVYDYYTTIEKKEDKSKIVKVDDNIKNKILDIHKDILNHPYVNKLVREPLGNIKDDATVKQLKELNKKDVDNYLNPNYDSQKYLESVDGKAMVGTTSLQNTFNSLLNQQEKIYLHEKDGEKYKIKYFLFNYKGEIHRLSDLTNPNDINGVPKNIGIRNVQSGAVDNSKDPVLGYINLNMTTSPVYNLLSILGVPNDYIEKFLPQPSLKEYVRRVKYNKSAFTEDYKSNDDILNDLITEYGKKVGAKIPLENINALIDQGKITLTEEALRYGYTPKDSNSKLPVPNLGINETEVLPYLIQYVVLYNFRQYKAYGENLDKAKSSINLDTSGIGKSFIVVNDKVDRLENNIIKENDYISGLDKLINNTVSGYQIEYSLLKAQEHFRHLMPYSKKTFEAIVESYGMITLKNTITEEDKYNLWIAYKSYLFTKFYPNIEAERKRLLHWNKEETSFAQRTKKLKEHPKYKNNPFIQRISPDEKVDITGKKPSLVYYTASKEEMIDEYNVVVGYRELFSDPLTKAWAEDSVKYFFINGGIQGAKEWGKYIPAGYLEQIGFSEFTRNIEFNDESLIGFQHGNPVNDFIVQYLQHNPYSLKSLTVTDAVKPIKGVITLPNITSVYAPKNLKDNSGTNYVPIFRVYGRIYLLNRVDGKYYLQPELGNSFYKEYNGNPKVIVAANEVKPELPPVKVEVIPTVQKEQPKGTEPKVIVNTKYSGLIKPKLSNTLDIIINKSKHPDFVYLAKLLKDSGLMDDVDLIVEPGNIWSGLFTPLKPNEIKINPDHIGSNKQAVEIILHETIHNFANRILLKQGVNLQSDAAKSFKNIYDTLVKKIQADELKGFDSEVYTKIIELTTNAKRTKSLTQEDKDFILDNFEYYPLTSFNEFIVGLFQNTGFQELLNDNKWDKNKSFLDRLIDLVIGMIDDFYKSIGIKVNKDNAFDVAIKSLFNAIHEQSKIVSKDNATYSSDTSESYAVGDAKVKQTKEKVKRLLDDYDQRIKNIQSNISQAHIAKDYDRVTLLKKRKDELDDEIAKIKDQASLDILIEISKNDFDNINVLLDKKQLSLQDIEYMNTTLTMWSKIGREDYLLVTEKDVLARNEKAKKILEIVNKAKNLKDEVLIISRNHILNEANQITDNKLKSNDLKYLSDVNGATSWFLDLTKTGQRFVDVLAKAMQSAVALAKREGGDIQVQITNLVNNLKNSPLFREKGYDALIDKDENGNRTNELIKETTYEYRKTLNELSKKIKDAPKALKEVATKKLFEWIKENHIITDITRLFERNSDGTYTWKPNQEYLDKIRGREGDNYNNFLQEQKNLIKKYNDELQSVIKNYANDYTSIEMWIKRNDPLVYINNLKDGYKQVADHKGRIIYNKGYKYIKLKHRDKWNNPLFNDIQNDKDLKAFYDFYTGTMKNLLEFVPKYMKDLKDYKISPTTIAGIKKDFLEKVTEDGSTSAFSDIKDKLINAFTENEVSDHSNQTVDIETGKDLLRLQPKYMSLLSTDQMTFDLGKVLNVFANELLLYKHKSNTEDFVRIGRRIVEQAEEVTKAPNGKLIKDAYDNPKKTKELESLIKQLDATIKSWYGVGRDDKKGGGWKIDKLTDIEKATLARELKELKESPEYALLNETEASNEELKILNKYQRYFSFTNSIDSLLKYVQLKGMGWNPFSGMTNYLFGEISNIIYSTAGVDFSNSDLNKARIKVLGDGKKVESLMIKYNVLKDIIDAHYKKQTNNNVLGKGLEWVSPFQLHKLGEYQVQGEILVAMMLKKKVKVTIDGKEQEIPLYEAYDENGNWKYGEDKSWEGDFNKKEDNRKWLDFKLKVDQVIAKVHGNYNPDAPIRAKRYVLGRALMQFRTWIPEGVESRFGAAKYDELLQRNVEGRYRTAGKIFNDYGFWTTANILLNPKTFFNNDTVFDILRTTDPGELALIKENMKKNLSELYIKLSMTALALILAGLDDDDDELTKKARNLALNTIYRMGDDIEFYYSPIAMENITRNIIPATGLIVDGYKFLDAIYEIDEDGFEFLPEAEAGIRAGETKAVYRGMKLLPLTSGLSGLFNKMETTETFRK